LGVEWSRGRFVIVPLHTRRSFFPPPQVIVRGSITSEAIAALAKALLPEVVRRMEASDANPPQPVPLENGPVVPPSNRPGHGDRAHEV
jgi:hypothetical protein